MRKLILYYCILTVSALSGAEPFRKWSNQDSKLKPIEAKLLEYDDAFERGKHTEYYQEWLGKKGIQDAVVPMVRFQVKIPQGRNPKKEPARKKDYEVPLSVLSQEDRDYVLDWHWLRQREDFFKQCLKVVLGERREMRTQRPRVDDGQSPPDLYDIIYFRNGSRKRGVVLNKNFSLHTAYGEFVVSADRLAAIQFVGAEGGRSVLTGVNNNRLSGFLDLPGSPEVNEPNHLAFKTANEQQSVRKEDVDRIVYHVREGELDGLGGEGSVNLRLTNGDYLDAKVYGGELPIAGRNVPVGEVTRVEFAGGQASVFFKDGGRDAWNFTEEDLPVALDIGPKFTVYHAHIEKMYCDAGFRPLGYIVEAATEREASISFERDAPLGRVRAPSSSSLFHGMLEGGDRIVSVNREAADFEAREDSFETAIDALFDEDEPASKIELGVQRGKTFFLITIIRESGAGA